MDITRLIEKGNYKSLKKLLDKDKTINLNDLEIELEPALFFVLEQEMLDIAHLMIDYGYNVKMLTSYGKSLPMATNDTELIKKLLNLGAFINIKDQLFHQSVLSNALDVHNIELAQYLIERGANVKDVQWNTVSIIHKENMLSFAQALKEKDDLEYALNKNNADSDDDNLSSFESKTLSLGKKIKL